MYQLAFASTEDIPALNILVNSAYRGESSKQGWTTEADLLDGIRTDEKGLQNTLEKPNSWILKCVDELCQILACVHLEKNADQLYLGMLTVAPNLQNKGIGKLLLLEAEKMASQQACTSIYMTVITERTELIAWYVKHGYTNTGITKPFPMDDPAFGLPKKQLEFVVLQKDILF
jgi:ribosomal protein S18 acetylase RimI-like enzyme